MSRRAKAWIAATIAVAIGASTGIAIAVFSINGSGSGTASTSTAQGVTVEETTGTVSSKLYPGASADLVVELDNPNPFSVEITSVSAGTGSVSGSGGVGTCSTTGVSVPTQTGLTIVVAPGDHQVAHIPAGVAMGTTSDSGCQGATFSVPVTLTLQQAP